jgi:biopolymer transport protein ExbD
MKLTKPESHATHPNVVPMIDVIMCLIIFYMLVARIGINTGEDEAIVIPFAKIASDIKSMDNTLLVNVKEAGGIDPETNKWKGNGSGTPVVSAMVDSISGKQEELVISGAPNGKPLDQVLRRFRFGKDMKKGGSGENADNAEFKLVVRGDKDMPFSVLQQVLLDAAKAEVKSFNFQTSAKEIKKKEG